jgi:hypothetical protein
MPRYPDTPLLYLTISHLFLPFCLEIAQKNT